MNTLQKTSLAVGILLVLVGAIWFFQYRSSNDTLLPVSTGNGEVVPFLTVPEGFSATYYAKNIPKARVMEFVPGGMLVSQTPEGKVSLVEGDGTVTTLLSDLDAPHGLASRCDSEDVCDLYVATQSSLYRYTYHPRLKEATKQTKLLSFDASPGKDRHRTRTLMFLPAPHENTLLISIGSSCDTCIEEGQYAKILSYDLLTEKVSTYATGLRNAVFMALHPVNGMVFATEMGRDGLGDTLPPDEVNIIDEGYGIPQDFGWPICYGKNIHDTAFDKNTYIQNPCAHPMTMPSWFDLPAHVAPLGLSFIPEEGWPEDMWFDLLVAQHGSSSRSNPVGFKIVKVDINWKGQPGVPEDFVTGFRGPDGITHGRPVDVKVLPGGVVYISDDYAGAIYRIARTGE